MYSRKHGFTVISIGAALIICFVSLHRNSAKPFHTELEKEFFSNKLLTPIDSDQYFLGSIRCKGCHGFDTLNIASIDADGVDINLYDDWQTTMMANSSRDPLWRAKVSHEILVNPGHAEELQTKCTSCHAPMGHFTAIYKGASSYTLNDVYGDTLAIDGVACGGCHEIGTQSLGTTFSGAIPYDTSNKEFGPFQSPLVGPMQLYVGLIPTYSTHVSEGSFCSSCHTLIINTADLDGNYTGNTFTEQATYHEWLNSALSADNITCQKCHMPQVTDSIVIANDILSLDPRSPFNMHQFAGGNWFMINLIKQNKDALGITAPDVNFDSTLAATTRMLRQKSLSVHLFLDSLSEDTAFLRLQITNKAGHKFPSGYPSRRAVAQLIVLDQNLDTVFQSGTFDSNYEVKNINPQYEPHYDVIRTQGESQIYETVMEDVNHNVTTVLERADHFVKDNRIPPEGFVSTHPVYDTVKIEGDALNDPNFNKISGSEGSGRDYVFYHVPLNGTGGVVTAFASVYYQAVPPKWVENMFTYSSPEIDAFKDMYASADRSPFLVGSDTITDIPIPTSSGVMPSTTSLQILNSLNAGTAMIQNGAHLMVYSVYIFGAGGKLMSSLYINSDNSFIPLQLPEEQGIYFIDINTNRGTVVFKTIRM